MHWKPPYSYVEKKIIICDCNFIYRAKKLLVTSLVCHLVPSFSKTLVHNSTRVKCSNRWSVAIQCVITMIHCPDGFATVHLITLKLRFHLAIKIRYIHISASSLASFKRNEMIKGSLFFKTDIFSVTEGRFYSSSWRLGSIFAGHRSARSITTSHIDFSTGRNIWIVGWEAWTGHGLIA